MSGGFYSFGLRPELLKAIDDQGWLLPTDVQDESIPLILGGGDVCVSAETGSGKTACFVLSILQCVSERLKCLEKEDLDKKKTTTTHSSSIVKIDCKINESDRDAQLIIENNGSMAHGMNDKVWIGGRCTHGVRSGKYYYEATLLKPSNISGICRFGWSSMASHYELGKDAYGFGYGGTAMKSHNNTFATYGVKYSGESTVIGCCIDRDFNTISYSVNGKDQGKAFDIPECLSKTVLFPAFVFKGAGASFNFGIVKFNYLPPSYSGLSTPSAMMDVVSWNSNDAFKSDVAGTGVRHPLAVIIQPSRELAEQVYQNIKSLSQYLTDPELRVTLLIGGGSSEYDSKKLTKTLKSIGCDVIIGTLGKLTEMVKSNIVDFSHIRFFILDEADRMTDPDNLRMIMSLYNACPVGGSGDNRLQVCFFSATLHSPAIRNLSEMICSNPTWVDLKGIDCVPDTVHHVVCNVDLKYHLKYLINAKTLSITDMVHDENIINHVMNTIQSKHSENEIISKLFNTNNSRLNTMEIKSQLIKELKQHICLQIIDQFQMSQCMIFCRTNLDCDNLETFFCKVGNGKKFSGKTETGKENLYSCCVLGGMRTQDERRKSLEAFKSGDVRLLICTDIAARGIDVVGLPFVINMTLPDESENYIHRIGRVGRTTKMGLAISIIAPSSSHRDNNSESTNVYTEKSSCSCCSNDQYCSEHLTYATLSTNKEGGKLAVDQFEGDWEEKVWYHTCSSRGKGCVNRKVKSDGGCTIWYNESQLLDLIKERLHIENSEKMPELSPSSFSLPSAIADLGIVYGEDSLKPDESNSFGGVSSIIQMQNRLGKLSKTVQELAHMENEAQNIFLMYKTQFS